jgi:phosphoglycolate phosphatase-like HAD superfamily hydrolase
MRGFTTYLFDLDGTLIDSGELIMSSFRHTMKAHLGTVPPDAWWRAGFGTPLRPQLARYARDPVIEAVARLDTSVEETVFIGDAPVDCLAGRAAGVTTAAALWGPFSRAALEPHDPDHWLAKPADILQLG